MRPLTLALVCIALVSCGPPREADDVPADGNSAEVGSEAPSEITMTCDGTTTRLDAPAAVKVQPDGVHITLVNSSGKDLGFSVSFPSGGGFGENAPRNKGRLVLSLPPGEVRIGCPDPEFEGDPTENLPALTVLDPDSLYVPKELECTTDSASGASIDYGSGAEGEKRNPVDIVREQFSSELVSGDEVVRAGYPDEVGDLTVAIRRDGRTVVSVHFFGNDREGYLSDSEDICGDFRP